MAQWPTYMDPVEACICDRLLTEILGNPDYQVRVWDGEEWVTDWSRDRDLIQQRTALTEETCWSVRHRSQGRIGAYALIHGDHADVISNWVWVHDEAEATLEDLSKAALDLAKTLL